MKSIIDNSVNIGGQQTISGEKTLLSKLTLGNSTGHMGELELFGGNSAYGGYIDFHYGNSNGDYTSRIIEDSSGNVTFNCTSVKAPATAVTNGVVTTKARSSSANGYIKFGNQVTLQKGTMSAGSGATHTITFPTPFQNTNYKFVFSFATDTGELYAGAVNTKTTTNIVLHTVGGANTRACDWIAMEIH